MTIFRKYFFSLLTVCSLIFPAMAQNELPPETQQLHQRATDYLQRKDYPNAIMLLNQAIHQASDNVALRRDLSYCYYLSNDLSKAREIITPVLQSDFADEQTYQIAAAIENGEDKYPKAKKILQSGIRKFPNSGLLYNNLGNLHSTNKGEKAALNSWMEGIRVQPDYPQNYYSASRMFFANKNYVWALIYGEFYVNMDKDPMRGNQIKKLLMDCYQAILSGKDNDDLSLPSFRTSKNEKPIEVSFEEAFKKTLMDNAIVINDGLSAESLTMLRTRFIMDWQINFSKKYPFSLFSYQFKMMNAGYFDAYNQWLFGAVSNSAGYQLWLKNFGDNFKNFEKWQQRNPFRPVGYDPKP